MRALIVDDSQFIRSYLGELLADLGIQAEQAGDGRAALDRLQQPDGPPAFNLALVDLNMPRMGGLDLLRRVRSLQAFAPMKVMMVTTEADMAFVSSALRMGADEFLMKPFSPESLKEKLQLLGFLE